MPSNWAFYNGVILLILSGMISEIYKKSLSFLPRKICFFAKGAYTYVTEDRPNGRTKCVYQTVEKMQSTSSDSFFAPVAYVCIRAFCKKIRLPRILHFLNSLCKILKRVFCKKKFLLSTFQQAVMLDELANLTQIESNAKNTL